eukprot:CAMPEP_0115146926 /NCGR_PEP_ID=MMETSP0227-20121206/62995_1 /TAXON_ID=89957 /ORGANISM="Polarella glacialis, Strain CCMP 1383" /LENGTH=49 /DNA_ID= /DNA_START= /DNA_END= /DNA_ORIENTATION=
MSDGMEVEDSSSFQWGGSSASGGGAQREPGWPPQSLAHGYMATCRHGMC